MNFQDWSIGISLPKKYLPLLKNIISEHQVLLIASALIALSVGYFNFFFDNGLNLAYNDARSHLDIGRRVVEGLKPGIAQLGSVWLPLQHILMLPFIWDDFMWHTGLAGSVTSMATFVGTGILIYFFLKELSVGIIGRLVGIALFAFNLNILYLQSTAMTELLLIFTTTAASYYLLLWAKRGLLLDLVKSAAWVMMASLARYDGWFLFLVEGLLIWLIILFQHATFKTVLSFSNIKASIQKIEGLSLLFATMAGFGIALWFLWNLLIFGDPLFFAFGPYSAHAQQTQLADAGDLITKGNLLLSAKTYFYAMFFNLNTFVSIVGFIGAIFLWFDKNIDKKVRIASIALITPLLFNIVALYFGHSVLFIQGINGNTWFNVRYGVSLISSIAIFGGYMVDRLKSFKGILIGLLIFVIFFQFANFDAVTIDDARVGSSQKNVTEVSSWLAHNAKDRKGFILISAASHDAIIFSSGLPMSKFIHEGTGSYWLSATTAPDKWARWIVMRTYDDNDQTYKLIKANEGFSKYRLVSTYPFASIYELKDQYLNELHTEPVYTNQK